MLHIIIIILTQLHYSSENSKEVCFFIRGDATQFEYCMHDLTWMRQCHVQWEHGDHAIIVNC